MATIPSTLPVQTLATSTAQAVAPEVMQPLAITEKKQPTNLALTYLRAFATLLVVFHHSTSAYFPLRPQVAVSLDQPVRWWYAFPVVDKVQWWGFRFTLLFNDVFFMSLFFLLSGLFAWNSLKRHGVLDFLRKRLVRLGIPFAFFSLLSPIGYYPAYLQSQTHDGFWHEWMGLHYWPSGPEWFIGVLLVFDFLLTGVFKLMPTRFERLSRYTIRLKDPLAIGAALFLLTCAAYLPMVMHFNPYQIFTWGPFLIQKVRALLYPLYFLIGVALGAAGIQNGPLRHGGRLAGQWLGWMIAAAVCFGIMEECLYFSHRIWNPPMWTLVMGIAFSLSCVASCLACLSFFLRFVKIERPLLTSLAACAYGIYLIHYFFVSWIQYGLLSISAPGWLKGVLVFSIAVMLSWGLVHMLRKLPLLARIL